jgi:hypothetical protein
MKTLEYTLSNFGSLFFNFAKNFDLETISTEHLKLSNSNNQLNFRRVWLESGLEAWCFSMNLDERINIIHEKSNSAFFTVNFWDFEGEFSISKPLPEALPCQGIVYLSGDSTCRIEIQANIPIKWITLVFSKRWFTSVLLKCKNGDKILKMFESPYSISKLSSSYLTEVAEILNISKNDEKNGFLLKSKIYQILNNYFSQLNKLAQEDDSLNKQNNRENVELPICIALLIITLKFAAIVPAFAVQ